MRWTTTLLVVTLAGCNAPPATTPDTTATAYVGATLVDGTGAEPVADAVLLVVDGRIACAGTATDCPVPSQAESVDLNGRWIAPGLVDAHVHFAQTAWADGRPDGLNVTDDHPYAAVVSGQRDNVTTTYRSYLCSGVTAVFDVGGFPWSWALRDDVEEGVAVRGSSGETVAPPHVAAAGPLLTWVPARMSLPAEQVMVQIDDEAEGREAVGYLAGFGTDAVKVWLLAVPEGDPDTPSREQVDARVMAIGETARQRDLPLIVHATSLREAKVALRAGASLLVHSVNDEPVDAEFLALARDRGTIYTPTLLVGEHSSSMYAHALNGETPVIDDPNGCVDPATREKIRSTPDYADRVAARFTAEAIEARTQRNRRASEITTDNLRRIHEAGITVAMGTDAGNPLTVHGPSVYVEMERMQAAGLKAADIVVMATRNGARAMGRQDDLGTLEAGKMADFIVLREDPTADVAAFRSVDQVARAGTLVPITALAFERERP